MPAAMIGRPEQHSGSEISNVEMDKEPFRRNNMAAMRRKLGVDGPEVSAMGFGCWAIGGPFAFDGRPAGWGEVDDMSRFGRSDRHWTSA